MKEVVTDEKPDALKRVLFKSQVGREPEIVEADGCLATVLRFLGINLTNWERPDSQKYELGPDGKTLRSLPEGEWVDLDEEARSLHQASQVQKYLEDNGII